jgi:hypothetical protein
MGTKLTTMTTKRVVEVYSWPGRDGAPEFGFVGLDGASRDELYEIAHVALAMVERLTKTYRGEVPFNTDAALTTVERLTRGGSRGDR